MGSNAQIPRLGPLVAQAWRAFERARRLPSHVSPAIPILFFGDIDAYCRSPVRMLTVGLNPSLEEFPARKPFRRFPVAASVTGEDRDRYVKALSAYFRTDPYHTWFRHFEPLLNGARSNYYPGWPSTALHTDICSPVATNPTWSRLSNSDRATLEVYGLPLWHSLLEALRPHVVVLSVARIHLDRIVFDGLDRWKVIHTFERTDSGKLRSRPYAVRACWYDIGGDPSLFVFCPAGRTPLTISSRQKRDAGAIALQVWMDGR